MSGCREVGRVLRSIFVQDIDGGDSQQGPHRSWRSPRPTPHGRATRPRAIAEPVGRCLPIWAGVRY